MQLTPIASNMTEIYTGDGVSILFSYQTPVAAFVPGKGILRTEKFWSVTTSKNINKWIKGSAPSATVTLVPQSEIEALLNC